MVAVIVAAGIDGRVGIRDGEGIGRRLDVIPREADILERDGRLPGLPLPAGETEKAPGISGRSKNTFPCWMTVKDPLYRSPASTRTVQVRGIWFSPVYSSTDSDQRSMAL